MNEVDKIATLTPDEVLKGLRDSSSDVLMALQNIMNPQEIDGIEVSPDELRATAAAKLREHVELMARYSSRAGSILVGVNEILSLSQAANAAVIKTCTAAQVERDQAEEAVRGAAETIAGLKMLALAAGLAAVLDLSWRLVAWLL